jgi:hypothetical protein
VAAGTDFHLATGSPAIGVGNTTVGTLVRDDVYGTPRKGALDIGAVAKP